MAFINPVEGEALGRVADGLKVGWGEAHQAIRHLFQLQSGP